MATAPKGIKVSSLSPWTGDTNMKLHVHKPGVSEAVSIRQIASLASPGSSAGYPGELIQRITGIYDDAVKADGAELPIAENLALYNALKLRQNDSTQYYDLAEPIRFYLDGISPDDRILDVKLFDDKIFAVSQSALDINAGTFGVYRLTGEQVSLLSIRLEDWIKFYTLLQAETTVYLGATVNGSEAVYAWNGSVMVKVLDGYSWQFHDVASYGAGKDILVYANKRVVVDAYSYSVILPMADWIGYTDFACCFDTKRLFIIAQNLIIPNEGDGVYEVFGLDTVSPVYVRVNDLSVTAVQSGKLIGGFSSDLYVVSGGSSGKVIMRYDTLNNVVYPSVGFPEGFRHGYAHKNALALWETEGMANAVPVMSFNYGESFEPAPVFNGSQVPEFSGNYFIQAGDPGSTGSESQGHLQLNKLKVSDPGTFFVPKLATLLPGYSYFLRK